MRSSMRRCAIVLVALGCAGLALAAQTGRRAVSQTPDVAADETTGSLGPTGARRMTQPLPLTDEERARIHARVIRMPNAPTADVPARCRRSWRCRTCRPEWRRRCRWWRATSS